MVNFKPLGKLIQRSLYSFIGTWSGIAIIIIGIFSIIGILLLPPLSPCESLLRGSHIHCSQIDFSDNIGHINLEPYLAYGPIDAVYSWVNGSDQVWATKKSYWYSLTTSSLSLKLNRTNTTKSDDTVSHNRFRDSEELRYSLRSLEKYAPWIRNIYLVTDNQIPYWLNLENPRIRIVPHSEIFLNKSDLPVFSSPAIETHIHRIKGLSKKFIYFNDDVFLGAPTSPEDFYFIGGAQRLYQAWDVPKCAPGCSDSWIGDGYCDKACNVSSCNFDYPDCINGTTGSRGSRGGSGYSNTPAKETFFCATGCPDSWLGDKVCDQKCKSIECGWDAGDCGVDIVVEDFPGTTLLTQNYTGLTLLKQKNHNYEIYQNNIHITNPSLSHHLHPNHILINHNEIKKDLNNNTNSNNNSNNDNDSYLYPIALTIPYGSYAAYVNLSYLPCTALHISSTTHSNENNLKQKTLFPYSAAFSPTCSESNILSPFSSVGGNLGQHRTKMNELPSWTNFTYLTLNYTISPVYNPKDNQNNNKDNNNNTEITSTDLTAEEKKEIENAVSFTIFIIKHNMLMVLFRGHDKEFIDTALPKKEFNYRKPLDVRFNITGQNVISGVTITALFSIRMVSIEKKVPIDNSIPEGMKPIIGFTSSCLDLKQPNYKQQLTIQSIKHHQSPFEFNNNNNNNNNNITSEIKSKLQGIVVSVFIEGMSPELSQTPINKIVSMSTITPLSGESVTYEAKLCESIANIIPYEQTTKKEQIGSLSICDDSILFGNIFYPSQTRSEVEVLDLLLYVPISWYDLPVNASGDPFYTHMTLELYIVNSQQQSQEDNQLTNTLNITKELTNQSLSQNINIKTNNILNININNNNNDNNRILCIGGVYKWGGKNSMNENLLNQTNSSLSLFNLTSTNITNTTHSSSLSSSTNQNEKVEEVEKVDTYASSLRYVNSLYHKAFGAENRKVPAHIPHMIDVEIMNEMQEKWKDEWEKTSKHRFRSPEDMQYAFAYYYYVIHRNKAKQPNVLAYIKKEIDTDGDGYINNNEFLTLAAITYNKSPTESEIKELRNCTSENYTLYELDGDKEDLVSKESKENHKELEITNFNETNHTIIDSIHLESKNSTLNIDENEINNEKSYVKTLETHKYYSSGDLKITYTIHRHPTIEEVMNCNISREGILKHVNWPPTHKLENDQIVSFEMIGDNITHTLNQLNSVRHRKSKFICINDQMENPSNELKQILKDFYLSFFPYQSQFELPSFRRNPTLYYDEYLKIYNLPEDYHHHPIEISLYNRFIGLYKEFILLIREFLLESILSLYDWISGESSTPPQSTLLHWSKGLKQSKLSTTGFNLFIPYSSIFWSSIGLCLLIMLRMLFRMSRKKQLKNKNTIIPNVFETEKRRYYQSGGKKQYIDDREESIEEIVEDENENEDDNDNDNQNQNNLEANTKNNQSLENDDEDDENLYDREGEQIFSNAELAHPNDEEKSSKEDVLNQLWKSAGYGVSSKKNVDRFVKGGDNTALESPKTQKSSKVGDLDDRSISTLGMEGWEEQSIEKDPSKRKKKKSVRFGGNSVASDASSRGGVSQMFRGFTKNFEGKKKNT